MSCNYMQAKHNQIRLMAAGLVLASGTAYAGHRLSTPPKYTGPTASQIRRIAERVPAESELAPAAPLNLPTPRPARAVTVSPSRPAPPRQAVQPSLSSASEPEPTGEELDELETDVEESPVKSIALTGVTFLGDRPQAWLVDLDTNERETAGEGEEIFGFTVQEIRGDQVILASGEDEYPLRLWEKRTVEETPAETPPVTTQNPRDNFRNRFSRRGFGGGPQRASGRSFRSNRSSRNRSGRGRRRSASSRSAAYNRGYRRSAGSSSNNSNSSRRSSFFPFGFSRNRGGYNQQTRQYTPNPQTSRRTDARLIGDAPRIENPSPISNPQTYRRRGTRSEQGFGSNRNSSSRSRR